MQIKKLIFFLLLFGLLGYFREFFFVNINNIMFQKYYGHTDLPIPKIMLFFNALSYKTLYYLKYPFTLIWVALFFFTNYFALKHIATQHPSIIKILIYSYILLLTLASITMLYGYFVKEHLQEDEYTISRWLLGIAQSPIICLILIASEKLYPKNLKS